MCRQSYDKAFSVLSSVSKGEYTATKKSKYSQKSPDSYQSPLLWFWKYGLFHWWNQDRTLQNSAKTVAFACPKPWAGYEPAAPIDLIGTDGAEYVNENALSVTIKHLRDKLGAQDYIKTIYGIGYNWIRKEKIKSLIADISHQTKTPITNLLLYVNFCWKKSFQHRQKQMWKHYTINQKNCDF